MTSGGAEKKKGVTSTCNKCWVRGTPTTRGGFPETLNKIEERKAKRAAVNDSQTRTSKAKAQEENKGVNRSVKRNFKADKCNYLESLAAEAKEAAYHGNMRNLYATIRNLSGKYSKPARRRITSSSFSKKKVISAPAPIIEV